jgi:hypothetical protein
VAAFLLGVVRGKFNKEEGQPQAQAQPSPRDQAKRSPSMAMASRATSRHALSLSPSLSVSPSLSPSLFLSLPLSPTLVPRLDWSMRAYQASLRLPIAGQVFRMEAAAHRPLPTAHPRARLSMILWLRALRGPLKTRCYRQLAQPLVTERSTGPKVLLCAECAYLTSECHGSPVTHPQTNKCAQNNVTSKRLNGT